MITEDDFAGPLADLECLARLLDASHDLATGAVTPRAAEHLSAMIFAAHKMAAQMDRDLNALADQMKVR